MLLTTVRKVTSFHLVIQFSLSHHLKDVKLLIDMALWSGCKISAQIGEDIRKSEQQSLVSFLVNGLMRS